jgi:hypothetical protein
MKKLLYRIRHTTSFICTVRSTGCQSRGPFAICSYGSSTNPGPTTAPGSTTKSKFQKFGSAKNNYVHQFLKEEEDTTKTKRLSFFFFSFYYLLLYYIFMFFTRCFLNHTFYIYTLLQHTSSHSFNFY